MIAIIQAIVTAIVEIISKLTNKSTKLQTETQNQADVANARLRNTLEVEETNKAIKYAASKDHPIPSPSEWNKGVGLLIIISTIIITGCESQQHVTYIQSRLPIIEPPARPTIVIGNDTWTDRDEALVRYSMSLEQAIKAYNQYAKDTNDRNGY